MKDKIRDFWYSFPVQLTILHFRNNLSLLLLWLLTIVFVTGYRGKLFGLQYLFTDPEYMGKVGPASFGFLGVAFGVFVMVWHMSSYLLSAFRFPFGFSGTAFQQIYHQQFYLSGHRFCSNTLIHHLLAKIR